MEAASPQSLTLKTALTSMAICGLAFILTAAAIHVCIPSPILLHADLRSEKLLLLDQWNSRANSAVFGTSHVHNGFDPRTFDAALAISDLDTKTVNLAIEGGSQTEQRVMALHFLHSINPQPAQPCFVVLELNAGVNTTSFFLVHPRTINIYDWHTVRFAAQLSPRSLGLKRAAGRIAFAVAGAALHYSNVGMLSNRIFTPPIDEATFAAETADDRRGLLAPPIQPGNSVVVKAFANMDRSLKANPEPLLPGNYDLLAELHRYAQANPHTRNVHFVYVVTPAIANLASYSDFPSEITVDGITSPIIAMDRPDRFPDLYQPANWVDDSHLSSDGAATLGRHVGEQVIAWYAAHPQPMNCGG